MVMGNLSWDRKEGCKWEAKNRKFEITNPARSEKLSLYDPIIKCTFVTKVADVRTEIISKVSYREDGLLRIRGACTRTPEASDLRQRSTRSSLRGFRGAAGSASALRRGTLDSLADRSGLAALSLQPGSEITQLSPYHQFGMLKRKSNNQIESQIELNRTENNRNARFGYPFQFFIKMRFS